jgi:putative transposase
MPFLPRSYRNTARALRMFVHRSNLVSIWKWIQRYKQQKVSSKRIKKINEFIIDETQIKVGSQCIWLWWVAIIEPKHHRQILYQINISFEKNMLMP